MVQTENFNEENYEKTPQIYINSINDINHVLKSELDIDLEIKKSLNCIPYIKSSLLTSAVKPSINYI